MGAEINKQVLFYFIPWPAAALQHSWQWKKKKILSCYGRINTITQLIPPKVTKAATLIVFCSEQRTTL